MTLDEQRGILHMPFGRPAANFWGGDRKGADLFGNSLVAVDVNTGKLQWHFQAIHHDIWDWDLRSASGLIDIEQNGRKIPALAQVTGWMFILDRGQAESGPTGAGRAHREGGRVRFRRCHQRSPVPRFRFADR